MLEALPLRNFTLLDTFDIAKHGGESEDMIRSCDADQKTAVVRLVALGLGYRIRAVQARSQLLRLILDTYGARRLQMCCPLRTCASLSHEWAALEEIPERWISAFLKNREDYHY